MIFKKIYSIVKVYFLLFFLLISSASAQSWIKIDEVGTTDVYALSEHTGYIFAITKFNLFYSSEDGRNWQQTASKPNAESGYQSIYSYENALYIGTFSDGIFRSTDAGLTWDDFNTGLSNSAKNIISITGVDNFLFIGTDESGVYRINLNGGTWESFNNGLFTYGINVLDSVGDLLLTEAGMYSYIRRLDENSWRSIFLDDGELQRSIHSFINAGDYILAGTDNGVYRGAVDAANWERKDIAALPSRDVACFALNGDKLFAAIDFGNEHWIFESSNFGETWDFKWHEFSWLYDMIVYDEKLWAARLDGLWFYDLSGSTGVGDPSTNIPLDFLLSQNYPNPFNPITTIKFTVPSVVNEKFLSTTTKLVVYDVLGQEVTILINEELHPGEYEVKFDGSNLPSGTYFYRIEVGQEYSAINKMLLLK